MLAPSQAVRKVRCSHPRAQHGGSLSGFQERVKTARFAACVRACVCVCVCLCVHVSVCLCVCVCVSGVMGPCPLAPSPGQRGHPVPTPQVQAGTWQKQLGTGRPSRRRWPAKRWKGSRPEGVARRGSLLLSPEATSGSRRARGSECRAGDVRRDSDRSWGAGAPEPLRGAGIPKPGPRSARGAQRARGRPRPTPCGLSTQQPRGAVSLRRPGGAHGRLCWWSEGGAPASWKRWGSGDADLPLGARPVRRIGLPLRTGRGRAAPTRPRGRQAVCFRLALPG